MLDRHETGEVDCLGGSAPRRRGGTEGTKISTQEDIHRGKEQATRGCETKRIAGMAHFQKLVSMNYYMP